MSRDPFARAHARLCGKVAGVVTLNEPLSRYTTLRVGGPARIMAIADTLGDLRMLLEACAEESVPWSVIGKGSNLLVSDHGYDGMMIQLGTDFRGTKRDGNGLQAGAAVPLPVLVQMAVREELGGLAFAVGIPGTVGGAIIGNAGAHGSNIGDRVVSVTLCDSGGRLRRCNRSELRFGYRDSSIHQGEVMVEALLALEPDEPARIRGEMERHFRRRKMSQPTGLPSAGSVFKNTAGRSAGKLIETAGLKGFTVGGAQISTRHANFIVNVGSATATDVYSLIRTIQDRVLAVHGVKLEPEVRMLGEFDVDRSEVGTSFAG